MKTSSNNSSSSNTSSQSNDTFLNDSAFISSKQKNSNGSSSLPTIPIKQPPKSSGTAPQSTNEVGDGGSISSSSPNVLPQPSTISITSPTAGPRTTTTATQATSPPTISQATNPTALIGGVSDSSIPTAFFDITFYNGQGSWLISALIFLVLKTSSNSSSFSKISSQYTDSVLNDSESILSKHKNKNGLAPVPAKQQDTDGLVSSSSLLVKQPLKPSGTLPSSMNEVGNEKSSSSSSQTNSSQSSTISTTGSSVGSGATNTVSQATDPTYVSGGVSVLSLYIFHPHLQEC